MKKVSIIVNQQNSRRKVRFQKQVWQQNEPITSFQRCVKKDPQSSRPVCQLSGTMLPSIAPNALFASSKVAMLSRPCWQCSAWVMRYFSISSSCRSVTWLSDLANIIGGGSRFTRSQQDSATAGKFMRAFSPVDLIWPVCEGGIMSENYQWKPAITVFRYCIRSNNALNVPFWDSEIVP